MTWPDDYLIPGIKPFYQEEAGIIYIGNAIELIERIPSNSIDATILDPPFARAGGISCGSSSQLDDQFFELWWKKHCDELSRVIKNDGEGFVWCDWKTAHLIAKGFKPKFQTYDIWRVAQMLYHYREMPGQGQPFRSSVDQIAYIRGPKSKGERISRTTHNFISKYWYYGKHDNHPAEKDIAIAEILLKWCSDDGNVILDMFMGGGTVPMACVNLNRKFVAFERIREYAEIAVKRLRQGILNYGGQ